MRIVVWASGYGAYRGSERRAEVAVNGEVHRLRLGEPADVPQAVVAVLRQGRFKIELLESERKEGAT
jgi:hypothetical protein